MIEDQIKVLLVDDEPAILDQAEIYLERENENIQLTSVISADEALNLLNQEEFDVVVSDYQMPGTNGLELLKKINKQREEDLPFILFTGKGREEVAMEALNLGADRYVRKGGDPETQFGLLSDAITQEYTLYKKEKQLKKSEKEKRKILDSASEHVIYHDEDHKVKWANQAAADSVGEDLEELEGQKCYKIWGYQEKPCDTCPVTKALESGEVERGEVKSPDGRYWYITASPVFDEEGNIEGVVEVSLNITERKEHLEKLKKLSNEYETIFNNVQESIFLIDVTEEKDFEIQRLNPYEEEIMGYETEEVRGKTPVEAFGEELGKKFEKKYRRCLENKQTISYEEEVELSTGKKITLTRLTPMIIDDEVEKIIGTSLDITERKKMEREIWRRKNRFETLVSNAHEGIYIRDLDGTITYVNEKFAELHGYERNELIGMTSWDLLHEDSKEEIISEEKYNEKLIQEEDPVEIKIKRKDDEIRHALITNSKTVGIDGEEQIFGIVRDITEQKEQEKELERKNKYLEHVPEFVTIIDEKGQVKYRSQASSEIEDIVPEDIIGKDGLDFIHPDDREKTESLFSEVLENPGEEFRAELRAKTEEGWVWFEARAVNCLDNSDIDGIIVTGRDIDRWKEKEKELKQKEEYIKYSPDITIVLDEEGIVKYQSHLGDEILGSKKLDLIGKKPFDLVHPDYQERVMDSFDTVLENPEEIDITEFKFKTPDGWRWFETRAQNSLDDPDIDGIILSVRDITRRKETEKELEERNEKIKKLHEKATELNKCQNEVEVCEHVVDASEEILDFKVCGIDFVEDGKFVPIALSSEIEEGFIEREVEEAGISRKVYEEGESLLVKDRRDLDFSKPVVSEYRASITIPLDDMGIYQALSTEVGTFDEKDLELAELLVNHASEAIKRLRSEQELKDSKKIVEELHEASAELERCHSEDEVYEKALETAKNILDFDMCGFDAVEGDRFVVKANTSEVPEGGYIGKKISEGGTSKKTYLNQESYLIDDLMADKDAKPVKTDYRSLISVPIDEFGIFQAVSTEPNHFDEDDLKMSELLIDHVIEALQRLKRNKRDEILHSLLRHDVGNKLQIANGYFTLLEDFGDFSEETEKMIDKTKDAIRSGEEIIQKIRKLRKIDTEDEVRMRDINTAIEKAVEIHGDKKEEKGIDIEMETTRCEVKAGSLIEEVFSNLIENSIKHSDCSLIKISVEVKEENCLVKFEDDGIGIDDDLKNKIFKSGFKKGEKAGSGLGMYLVKEIIDTYDGYVEVSDSDLGGAKFEIYLKKENL